MNRSLQGAGSSRPLFFVLLVAIPLALYGRTASFSYVNADDVDLIAGNQRFLSDLSNLPEAFTRSYFETSTEVGDLKTYYRPVAISSFIIDAQRGGARPGPYHVTNVVLHTAVVVLLFVWLRSFDGVTPRAALVAAAIFAVHPLNAQAVAWIAGRNELLFGLFTLAAVIALQRWSGAQTLWLAIHTLAFALAVFSKETAIVLPMVALLHLGVTRQSIDRTAAAALAAVYVAVISVWLVLSTRALDGLPASGSPGEAVANLPQLLVYAGKTVIPLQLSVMPSVDRAGVVLGAVAILAGALVLSRVPRQIAALAAVWSLSFLIPGLFVPDMPAYEHRMYVPLLGVALAVAHLPALASAQRGGIVIAMVAVAALAGQTVAHSAVFRDPVAYWSNGTRSTRFAPIAHVNLGQLYEQQGNLKRAAEEYQRALSLDPATPKAHNNLGVVYMRLEQPRLAVDHFLEETRRHPQNADAWFNMGLWAEMQGQPNDARRYYQRAIEANAAFVPAYEKLGIDPPKGP